MGVMGRRRWLRGFLCAIALGLAGATGALAHQLFGPLVITWSGSPGGTHRCTGTATSIWDGTYGKGAGNVTVYSRTGDSSCNLPQNEPAGEIRAKMDWLKQAPSGGWGVCWTSGQVYTNSARAEFGVTATFGSRICGEGYYNTEGTGAVFIAGYWRGGNVAVRSGRHWF